MEGGGERERERLRFKELAHANTEAGKSKIFRVGQQAGDLRSTKVTSQA